MTGNDPDGSGTRRIREYTAAFVLNLIQDRRARFPRFRCVYDDSDIFNFGDRHTKAISEAYQQAGLPWSAMCRIDCIHKETWRFMKDHGCFGVKVGIESAVPFVVNEIVHKQLNLNKATKRLRDLKEIGLTVHTTFTRGLPGEKKKFQEATEKYKDYLYRQGLTQTHQLSGTAEVCEATPLAILAAGTALPKYPGAKIDDGYEACSDGNEKMRRLALPVA